MKRFLFLLLFVTDLKQLRYSQSLSDWPHFTFQPQKVQPAWLQCKAYIEVVSSFAIEGESVSYDSVLSSLCKHMDVSYEGKGRRDAYSEGIARVAMDAIQPDTLITEDRIKTGQTALIKEYLSAPVYVVKVFRSRSIPGHQQPPLPRPLDPLPSWWVCTE